MNRRNFAALGFAAASLLFSGHSVLAQGIRSVPTEVHYPVTKAGPSFLKRDLPSRAAGLAEPPVRDLGAVDRMQHEVPNAYGQIPIGISQRMSDEVTAAGEWAALPDGRRVWRLALRSRQAAVVRVHFADFQVADGEVWVYGAGAEEVEGPFSGTGPFDDGDFWTGSIAGDEITIEYVAVPAGLEQEPPFRIESVSHLWEAPSGREVAPCHLDFKCSPAWAMAGAAVAHISYTDSADRRSYVCSGALLNPLGEQKQPYFLTAAHCIGDEFEARSVETYWNYESQSCNGPAPPGPSSVPRVAGSSRLVSGGDLEGDFSLLRLSRFPDVPVTLAGWTAEYVSPGQAATGIHHPDGSYKRISHGTTDNAQSTIVGGSLKPSQKYLWSWWNQGRTEGGSSGSPLFSANQQIIGVLSYGRVPPPPPLTVCDLNPVYGSYGRFSEFFAAVQPFLAGPPAPKISVSPSELSFSGDIGGAVSPASVTFQIRTDSATLLSFSVTSAQPWIRLTPVSGSVSSLAPATVRVSIDGSAFTTGGAFTGSVTVSVGSAAAQTVAIRVAMTLVRSVVVAEAVPNPVYESEPNAAGQRWLFDLRLRETAGVATVVRQLKINGFDQSSSIISWFGTDRLVAYGTLSVQLGTPGRTTPPYEDTFDIGGSDAATGLPWSRQVVVRFLPKHQPISLSVTPSSIAWSASTGSTATIESQLRINLSVASAAWTTRLVFEGSLRGWLSVSPPSGSGSATITLRGNPRDLPAGVHRATLSIESTSASPPRVDVPIQLSISGITAGGPVFRPEGVVNAASFLPSLAPGMLFTIFGQNLAPGTTLASEQPLPVTLLGTTVRVNGVICPLYYVSPGQINAQLPYEIQPGSASITLSAGGATHTRTVLVQPRAPGLFTIDGQRPTPYFQGRTGDVLIAYVTGCGQVTPAVASGHSPDPSTPLANLPVPVASIRVLVGGKQAAVLFSGIPPCVIGAIQVNYIIPSGLPAGAHSFHIEVDGVRTNAGRIDIHP